MGIRTLKQFEEVNLNYDLYLFDDMTFSIYNLVYIYLKLFLNEIYIEKISRLRSYLAQFVLNK